MANVNLDFSSVPSREVLAEGVYTFEIKTAEMKKSSTNKDMIVIRFEEAETKATIFENYVIDEKCLWKLQELCNALGLDTSGSLDIDTDMFVGQYIKGKVIQDEYNGDTVNHMKKVYAA